MGCRAPGGEERGEPVLERVDAGAAGDRGGGGRGAWGELVGYACGAGLGAGEVRLRGGVEAVGLAGGRLLGGFELAQLVFIVGKFVYCVLEQRSARAVPTCVLVQGVAQSCEALDGMNMSYPPRSPCP